MRQLHCTVLLAFLAVLATACDGDGGSLDAASEHDGTIDPVLDGDVTPEPAGDPAVETSTEPGGDPATEPVADPTTEPASDPHTDGANAGCVVRGTPGCGGCACESCVCEIEPHCCSLAWDDACVWDCEFICGEEC